MKSKTAHQDLSVYDNLHLHFDLTEPHLVEAMSRSAAFSQYTGETEPDGCIRVKHKGLRIEYRPNDCWGRIRGSLHSFAQGSNVGVFAAVEVAAACAALASSVGLPSELLVVRRLEAGVNITVPTSPKPFLETLNSHKKSPFWPVAPPSGCLRPLEYVAIHSDYKLKFYDKGAYATRQGTALPVGSKNLLRYEVVFTRARVLHKLTNRTQLTLADLPDSDVMAAIAGCVQENWYLTNRRTPLDYTGLSQSRAALLKAGSDLEWWEATRVGTPKSTFRGNQALYRTLKKQADSRVGPHPYDLLFSEHLKRLLPGQVAEEAAPKSGTFLHPCNQLEFGVGGNGQKVVEIDLIERQPLRSSTPSVPRLRVSVATHETRRKTLVDRANTRDFEVNTAVLPY